MNRRCGDNIVDGAFGEQCDLGGNNSEQPNASCRTDCAPRGCGDGVVDDAFGEECDDGAANSDAPNASCRSGCNAQQCGDGIVDGAFGEQCDDGDGNSDDPNADCRSDCEQRRCGDGVVDFAFGEECDDGNNDGGDGCDSGCFREFAPLSSDGHVQQALILDFFDDEGGCASGLPFSYIDEQNDRPRAGDVEAGDHVWRPYSLGIDEPCSSPCGVGVDVNCHFGGDGSGSPDQATAYGFIYLYSPDDRTAQLFGGSDDGYQVFVNGELVIDGQFACRCWADGQEEVDVNLVAGENRILVKVGENFGAFGYTLQFFDGNTGEPMLDLFTTMSP